jgi:hypothetical protein
MFFKIKNPLREDSGGFKQPNKKSCKFIYKEVFCFCKKLYFFFVTKTRRHKVFLLILRIIFLPQIKKINTDFLIILIL